MGRDWGLESEGERQRGRERQAGKNRKRETMIKNDG